ncbi:MAG: UvrD-helicase domain-containing protein [Spirochaetia bacterium]|nr:UvrD-helicase domain-containing protein [Spirochaetia bacterium]
MAADILANLNEPQREAVKKTEGPVLVLAGAGSGKTRTIVHRIAYLIHEKNIFPNRIVAVTFTNKAAGEMRQRVLEVAGDAAMSCILKTYHSLGLYLLRELCGYISFPRDFTIWDDTDQNGAINGVLESLSRDKLNKTHIKYFSQKIGSFKDNLISPEQLPEKINLDEIEFGDILQEVYHLYEQKKMDSRAMDFSDLLYQTVKIMENFPESLANFHRRYHYFLVDEYQDTNHSQYTMINLLAKGRNNLCVVGDDDQAIYTWRGANINNILDFNRDFPDAMTVKLEENYRSTQPVLDLANDVINQNKNRMDKALWTQIRDGQKPALYILNSDIDESKQIAAQIENAISSGVAPSEIAVLYRVNSQSRLIEEALLQKKIKYRVYGGVSFFGRKEVKDILAYLRFLVNPFDEAALLRLVNNPPRGIGEKSVERLVEFRNEVMQKERTLSDFLRIFSLIEDSGLNKKAADGISQLFTWMKDMREKIMRKVDFALLIEDVLERSGLKAAIEEEDRLLGTSRMENITELKNSMIFFQRTHPDAVLNDYLQEISLFSNTNDLGEPDDGVCLMTVHNAKGLEFDTVIIAGLDDGIFPHYLAAERDDGEEERRLLYVAITRARRQLFFTRAKRRMMQGFVQTTNPSVFISQINETLWEKNDYSLNQPGFVGYSGSRNNYGEKKAPGSYLQKQNEIIKNKTKNSFNNVIDLNNVNSAQKAGEFRSGDRVRHPNFGVGKIFKIEGSGDAAKVHIFFGDNKSRKFILKYTRLEKA